VDIDFGYEDVDEVRATASLTFGLVLTDDQADVLWDIYQAWKRQNNGARWYADAYLFLVASRDYDNHKWLMDKISSVIKYYPFGS